jgi:hypothetical protein
MHVSRRHSPPAAVVCAAGLLALLGVAACGGADSEPGAGAGSNPQVQEIHLPVPQQAIRPLTSKQARGLVPLPWSLVSILDGGRQVVIVVSQEGCSSFEGVTVEETSHRVILSALGPAVPANAACAVQSIFIEVRVELPAPIGSKVLSGP